jgi:ABC-2 type transport system ATP-binding protein
LEEADALADQVVIIADGRVADTGTPRQLKERFGTVVFTLGFAAPADARTASRLLAAAGYQAEADLAALRVSSDSGSGALPGLLRLLDRVPDPLSVAIREPTLDDVFLTLTGQVPASQGGSPA